jgi:5'-nucleotidase
MKHLNKAELKEFYEQQREQSLRIMNERLQEIRKRERIRMQYLKHLDPERIRSRHLKKLTILHSNDLHGDFLAEEIDANLIGGVSMLSGYISKVRNEEQNVIYAIAGDMFRGSLIDSEFRGISTIEIMNLLTPDVVTVGNHEVDYGLAHLLFLEKCASFPIINANMYVTLNESRLFRPYIVKKAGGLNILFIGAITEDVLSSTKAEELIGTLIDIRDAAEEIRRITDSYLSSDIDLTVLLTHIGFEEDKKLAEELGPDCNVDIIIGGHSHTYLEEPCVVAGIPIVQAAVGTNQIGRFDIVYDAFSKHIDSYTWKLIPVTAENCPRDLALEEVIDKYKKVTDDKYLRILTRFAREYSHTRTGAETELGDLIAGCMRAQLGSDLVLIASGSIRTESLGPIVTMEDLMLAFPYESAMIGLKLTGARIRKIMKYLLRDDMLDEDVWTEWFQFSNGFFCEYNKEDHEILKLTIDGKDVVDEELYSVAVQSFFYCSMDVFFGISAEEAEESSKATELASSMFNVLVEYFENHDYIKHDGEKRLLIH